MRPHELLEKEWAAFTGIEDVVACSSGTAALHLALECLRLPPGSRVLVPDYGMVAIPRAVVLAGHVPVFADCDPKTLNLHSSSVEDTMYDTSSHLPVRTPPSAAIVVVTCGRRVYPAVFDVCEQYGVPVIEDLAEAHGLKPDPRSYAACWSFYRNKVVHGEEGGAVGFMKSYPKEGLDMSDDPGGIIYSEHARRLRSLGFTPAHDYTHDPRGHNYRLADLLADPVRESIRSYPANLTARRVLEAGYEANCPAEWRMPYRDVPWVYDVRIPGMTRQRQTECVRALQAAGIPARFGFVPMTMQAEFRNSVHSGMVLPNSRAAYPEVVHLPLTPGVVRPEHCRDVFDTLYAVVPDLF